MQTIGVFVVLCLIQAHSLPNEVHPEGQRTTDVLSGNADTFRFAGLSSEDEPTAVGASVLICVHLSAILYEFPVMNYGLAGCLWSRGYCCTRGRRRQVHGRFAEEQTVQGQ